MSFPLVRSGSKEQIHPPQDETKVKSSPQNTPESSILNRHPEAGENSCCSYLTSIIESIFDFFEGVFYCVKDFLSCFFGNNKIVNPFENLKKPSREEAERIDAFMANPEIAKLPEEIREKVRSIGHYVQSIFSRVDEYSKTNPDYPLAAIVEFQIGEDKLRTELYIPIDNAQLSAENSHRILSNFLTACTQALQKHGKPRPAFFAGMTFPNIEIKAFCISQVQNRVLVFKHLNGTSTSSFSQFPAFTRRGAREIFTNEVNRLSNASHSVQDLFNQNGKLQRTSGLEVLARKQMERILTTILVNFDRNFESNNPQKVFITFKQEGNPFNLLLTYIPGVSSEDREKGKLAIMAGFDQFLAEGSLKTYSMVSVLVEKNSDNTILLREKSYTFESKKDGSRTSHSDQEYTGLNVNSAIKFAQEFLGQSFQRVPFEQFLLTT